MISTEVVSRKFQHENCYLETTLTDSLHRLGCQSDCNYIRIFSFAH